MLISNNSEMQEVAIIGINSLSGGSLARTLSEQGIKVLGFARTQNTEPIFLPYSSENNPFSSQIKVIHANLLSNSKMIAENIQDCRIRHVVNFAAQSMVAESWESPEDWYETNISATAKLLSHFVSQGVKKLDKFIQFSTPEVYGSTNGFLRESWHFNPSTPYAISRAASDQHIRCLYKVYNFPAIFTRAANVYGRHQKLYRVIPKFIVKAMKGERIELHGGGVSTRSFIHIDDVSKALLTILKSGQIGDTYHISTNQFISIGDLASMVLNKLGVSPGRLLDPSVDRIGKDLAYQLDSSKLRVELGWSDVVNLETGIEDVIEWIKKDWEKIKNNSVAYEHTK
jgi:dTDP-glucose 4,6-dehydratase